VAGGGLLVAHGAIQDELTAVKARSDEIKILKKDIEDAQKELRKTIDDAQNDLSAMKNRFEDTAAAAQDQVQQIGALIEEMVEGAKRPSPSAAAASSTATATGASGQTGSKQTPEELIRKVIKRSSFKWTTLGTLKKRTGFDAEQVVDLARSMPDVVMSIGKTSQERIFRLEDSEQAMPRSPNRGYPVV
jgi:hypothetical protein